MNNKLICPFCQRELEKVEWQDGDIEICCSNCDITGSAKLWQELIRTRKALDVAVNALNFYANKQHYKNEELDLYVYEYEDNNETGILDLDDGGQMENGKKARDALAEIKALEQKDVK